METLSKLLSFMLRHGAAKNNINITNDGYIQVSTLLNHSKFKKYTLRDIQQVVEHCQKQRFKLETISGVLHIRANQGHSLDVNVEMKLLTNDDIKDCIHGTYMDKLDIIKSKGLSKMARKHIHCAKYLPSETQKGIRASANVFIYINCEMAMKEGIQFFESANEVILSEGINGIIDPKYFLKIVDKEGNNL